MSNTSNMTRVKIFEKENDGSSAKTSIDVIYSPKDLSAKVGIKLGESAFMETISLKSNPHEFF